MQHAPHVWVEINATHLKNNILAIKKMLPEGTAYALVVKANAYGHDMTLISRFCEQEQLVDFFCVAYLTEAIQLRTAGIIKPILVMTYCDADSTQAINLEIDVTISNFEQLACFATIAQQMHKKLHVHIKIDTGLSRFGFVFDQIEALITILKQTPFLVICGIYSHFAESNALDQSYSQQQKKIFKEMVARFFSAGIRPTYIHQQNSAGIITQKDSLYTMVRIGALAYGLWSSPFQKELVTQQLEHQTINQIMSLKSRIIEIKEIPAETTVGYNRAFTTKQKTITAKIPIGYADGYFRYLGLCPEPAVVIVNNQYAPIIGYIAMNVITIDVTHLHDINLGDEVTLIGNMPRIHANELAHTMGSGNPREITTFINPTILRIIT